jgi:NAD(P)H-dependent FMN reductase
MSYLLAISGHPNKFSRPGFLLQALAKYLHPYQVELTAAYAIDFKADTADAPAHLSNLVGLIRNARGIVLLAPIPKDDWSGCLKAYWSVSQTAFSNINLSWWSVPEALSVRCRTWKMR